MANRILFLLVAVAGGLFTYFAARIQGVEDGWRQISAAIGVAVMLVLCLMLFVGNGSKGRFTWRP
jgi:hypothetical protein